ncbi:MAG: thiamine phosphate synthase [Chloroflexota bacterium]|nr:thiamine phosphate synthase [Dehalococcoidia bacterium]MDW8253082.1 thiamine phosphate synthase [Chloroflexota bacterium]
MRQPPKAGSFELTRREEVAARLRGLYVILDPEAGAIHALADAAIRGGARLLQLRDKRGPAAETLRRAEALGARARQAGVLFFINDRLDIALAAGADGVHLGQHDLPVRAARAVAGERLIIGCSTNTVAEALRAVADGADYLGVGAIFPTASKTDTRPAGIAGLRAIRAAVDCPIAAIGGITPSNAAEVIAAGADMIAVIGALAQAADPETAARQLAAAFGETP